jgi:prepilin-type N-terminal cleavage/methylation domain-containing protein
MAWADIKQQQRIVLMRGRRAFSLIELLVVIGIIGILLAILMPALRRVRLQAQTIACQSNMRQIGQAMMIYATENRGWLFPPDAGLSVPINERWFIYVLRVKPPLDPNTVDPKDWTPKLMLCPGDDQEPGEYHSYLLNHHLIEHHIMYSSKPPANLTPSDIVLAGEKLTSAGNYFVEILSGRTTYYDQVDESRHGRVYGSNYLYLDMHAGPRPKGLPMFGWDPWDFPDSNGATTAP